MEQRPFRFADGRDVALRPGFWAERLEVFRRVTIDDVFTKFEKDGALDNFRRVAAGETGGHRGAPWYDGLIYECIRGASDFLARQRDARLDRRLDGYIALIGEAQRAGGDGYLNTYTQLMMPAHRWGTAGGNLLTQHDLYNTGCLVEAGVHHYRATAKISLLGAAVRLANHVCAAIGPAPRLNVVPAHPLPEEAYLKLYGLLTEQPGLAQQLCADPAAYLSLVGFWLDARGRHEGRDSYPRHMGEYAQDHRPLREQRHAVGHSVRAALLYAGMAEYGNATGDGAYAEACRAIWRDITSRKMHVSGGIGAVHSEEKFGCEYQLPNDAYLETCASAALVFFARNLFEGSGDAEYLDVLERALYNGVLPGVSLRGDEYFYRNPLLSAGGERRWAWHECPCCPPMLLKVMGEMPSYLYATAEDGLSVNLYAASRFSGGGYLLEQTTSFPWDGAVRLDVHGPAREWTLRLRIPSYCDGFEIRVNGEVLDARVDRGYACIRRAWAEGDCVALALDMRPRAVQAHPYVEADRGRAALMRGPLLYCVEEADNDMHRIALPEALEIDVVEGGFAGAELRLRDTLGREVLAVPYYGWCNRQKGKMAVWLPIEGHAPAPAGEWGDDLYRPIR